MYNVAYTRTQQSPDLKFGLIATQYRSLLLPDKVEKFNFVLD